jgi:hypothetical protein
MIVTAFLDPGRDLEPPRLPYRLFASAIGYSREARRTSVFTLEPPSVPYRLSGIRAKRAADSLLDAELERP